MAENQYYDILIVGKTGTGKSTTGNKLLGRSQSDLSTIKRYYSRALHFLKGPPENDPNDNKAFLTADDVDSDQSRLSVTGWCEVLASQANNVRILDVPGFSTSIRSSTGEEQVTVYQGNLQVFRWIVRVQAALNIKTNRVLYFLPIQGSINKVDGVLLDELKVMYHFFGISVFENMIFVATNHVRKQRFGFEDEDERETKTTVHTALQMVVNDKAVFCPPLLYIAVSDTGTDILAAIRSAPVKSNKGMELKFRDDVCAKCAARTRYARAPGSNEVLPVGVINGDETSSEMTKYEESKCHTKFVQKYTTAAKFFGGILHIATLGVALLVENHWPGFTNSDEICEYCKRAPGSKGCYTVGDGKYVNHSSQVYTYSLS